MEEIYLYSLLRLKRKMTPIRETFPRCVNSWPDKPADINFRYSYNYLVKPPSLADLPKARGGRGILKSSVDKEKNYLTPHKSVSYIANSKKIQDSVITEAESVPTPHQVKSSSQSKFKKEVAQLKARLNQLEGLINR